MNYDSVNTPKMQAAFPKKQVIKPPTDGKFLLQLCRVIKPKKLAPAKVYTGWCKRLHVGHAQRIGCGHFR